MKSVQPIKSANIAISPDDTLRLLKKYALFQRENSYHKDMAIGKLLANYSDFASNKSAQIFEKEKLFLKSPEIQSWYQNKEKQRAETGERFNVFSALWLDRKENYHSRFIAYLLNPKENHDQGCRFLNAFLTDDKIGVEAVNESKVARVSVIPEYSIGKYGRIDIVIKIPHAVIAIENKVDAGEQENQITRYRQWLDDDRSNIVKKLVFLTPDRREPSKGTADVLLSYGDIVRFLDKAKIGLPPPILTVLEQYICICKSIHNGECFMQQIDIKTFDLLTQENNLEIALEIASKLEQVKERIMKVFVNNVVDILEMKIADTTEWIVDGSEQSNGWVRIKTKNHSNNNPNFCCKIENLFNWKSILGWVRPKWNDLKAVEQNESLLSEKMSGKDFKIEGWWIGLKALEPPLLFSENNIVVEVFDDNKSTERLLANQVASTLFSCFNEWYRDVEKLPAFIEVKQKSQK